MSEYNFLPIGSTISISLAMTWGMRLSPRYIKFSSKSGQIGPKWDNKSVTFSDHISVHFGRVGQNVLKSDLKKSQNCPICAQSDPLLAKSGYPVCLFCQVFCPPNNSDR